MTTVDATRPVTGGVDTHLDLLRIQQADLIAGRDPGRLGAPEVVSEGRVPASGGIGTSPRPADIGRQYS
jgi:hypothetical protein